MASLKKILLYKMIIFQIIVIFIGMTSIFNTRNYRWCEANYFGRAAFYLTSIKDISQQKINSEWEYFPYDEDRWLEGTGHLSNIRLRELISITESKEMILLVKSNQSDEMKKYNELGVIPIFKIENGKLNSYYYYYDDKWSEYGFDKIDAFGEERKWIKLRILYHNPMSGHNLSYQKNKDLSERFPPEIKIIYANPYNILEIFEEGELIASVDISKEIETKKFKIFKDPAKNDNFLYLNLADPNKNYTFGIRIGTLRKYNVPDGYIMHSNLNCGPDSNCLKLENAKFSYDLYKEIGDRVDFKDLNEKKFQDVDPKDLNQTIDFHYMLDGEYVKRSIQFSWIENKNGACKI